MSDINDNLVLICGESSTGKSASLMNLRNPEGVMYLNTEANKKLPFPAKFMKNKAGEIGFSVTDTLQVEAAFEHAKTTNCHTIVIDSLTFLLDQYESLHVLTAPNTMKAWSDFQQYFKRLMQHHVAKADLNVIFIAHTQAIYSEDSQAVEVKVPVKGALKANGIESYFSTVVSTKKVLLKDLADQESKLLNITPEDEAVGYKHCFQTKVTKKTTNERMRSPMGMFSVKETFIDNDAQLLLDRLQEYYQ